VWVGTAIRIFSIDVGNLHTHTDLVVKFPTEMCMSPSRLAVGDFGLPPMQLRGRSHGPAGALHLHASHLMRGLYLVAALTLPALGIHLADRPARTLDAEATQVAAVRLAPPLRTAAISPSPNRR
jgi:hypothetical protein